MASPPSWRRRRRQGAPPPTTGGLKDLDLGRTEITEAGRAALASALDSGALPALESLCLYGIPASDAARATVWRAGVHVNHHVWLGSQ